MPRYLGDISNTKLKANPFSGWVERQIWQDVEQAARIANVALPIGWLPLGAMELAAGNVVPALLGTLGLGLAGSARAQVNLPPDTDLASVRRKVAFDLYYIKRLGWRLDLAILLATACHVLVPLSPRRFFRLSEQDSAAALPGGAEAGARPATQAV